MNPSKFDKWRKAWRISLLGKRWDKTTPDSKEIIASLERIADTRVDERQPSDPFGSIFALRALAMAYSTPGTKFYGKEEVKNEIFDGLLLAEKNEYNLDISKPGHWWLLQIGYPMRLLDILILMYDELPTGDEYIQKWTDIILHFQDAYSLVSMGGKETGANLMWKCHVFLLTGILRNDMELIKWANTSLSEILQYSNKIDNQGLGLYDDGFYPDGSFIQHYFFAYTGGYGRHLLNVLAGLMYAFDGEDCLAIDNEKRQFIYDAIRKSYEPLVYKGLFMDIARGREITRYYHQDNVIGRHFIRGLCYLSSVIEGEAQKSVRAMIKEWFNHGKTRELLLQDDTRRAEYFIHPSMAEIVKDIEEDSAMPRGELIGHYNFSVMCKTVHLRKNYGFAISMYSPTIARYECVSHEGARSWHISDGVTYLYTSDTGQYNNDYYGSVDMQRLPGITVDRSPNRYTDPYFTWYLPENKNIYSFAGGVTMGMYGVTGLQHRGQGNGKECDLEVKKSWFMFDDEIVCLGSGITSTSGNPIETIIDNKRLNMQNRITHSGDSTKGCSELIGPETVKEVDFIHLTGNEANGSDIGYYFPRKENVHILLEKRKGDWSNLYGDPEHLCENTFATMWVSHGAHPKNEDYAYVLLPDKTADETRQYSEAPEIEVLECTESAHAVKHKHLNILGINFWNKEPYTCEGITCNTQASILMRNHPDYIEIAIADPTKTDETINVSFDFGIKGIHEKPEQIEISSYNPLTISVDTTNLHGGSLYVRVRC